MSGSGDGFGADTEWLENVRRLTATDYRREYTGVLAATSERVRIITLAPELTDIDAAVDAFAQVSDTWSFEIGGFVADSPAVVDGNVYFGSVDGTVYALNGE